MHTLTDPFEISATYLPPPARAPMMTISVDVDFDLDMLPAIETRTGSQPDGAPDSWSRVRCWCSED